MRAMVVDAMAAGAAGVSSSAAPTHLDLDDRPVPSRLAEPRRARGARRRRRAGRRGSIAYLPASAIGGIDADDEDYLIRLGAVSGLPVVIQGLGGRNKTDAPTATWEAAQSFLDRATAAGAPVYSMLIARPFDRPIVIDETNFHYLAVPSWNRHAAAAARRAGRRVCATPRRAPSCARRSSTTTAIPRWAPRCRRRCGAPSTSTRCRSPSTRHCSRARSPTSRASRASRRPTSCSTSRSPKTSRPGSAGGPRARSGRRPSARRSSTRG